MEVEAEMKSGLLLSSSPDHTGAQNRVLVDDLEVCFRRGKHLFHR